MTAAARTRAAASGTAPAGFAAFFITINASDDQPHKDGQNKQYNHCRQIGNKKLNHNIALL